MTEPRYHTAFEPTEFVNARTEFSPNPLFLATLAITRHFFDQTLL